MSCLPLLLHRGLSRVEEFVLIVGALGIVVLAFSLREFLEQRRTDSVDPVALGLLVLGVVTTVGAPSCCCGRAGAA